MDEVCDVKDCPMYGHFVDMSKHPTAVALRKIIEDLSKSDDVYKKTSAELRTLSFTIRMRFMCSSCCHFTKPDMSQILIKEEAKKLLSKE